MAKVASSSLLSGTWGFFIMSVFRTKVEGWLGPGKMFHGNPRSTKRKARRATAIDEEKLKAGDDLSLLERRPMRLIPVSPNIQAFCFQVFSLAPVRIDRGRLSPIKEAAKATDYN